MVPIEAVLVRDGMIVATGEFATLQARAGSATRMLDLKGKTLLPGLIDPHSHPDITAYLHSFVDLSGFTHATPQAVWEALRKAVATAVPGEWIAARGFDPVLISDLEAPSIGFLDQIAPDNPLIIVAQSLHSAWANSAAFRAMGIDHDTANPSNGSYYERDADGQLTGFIVETQAIKPIMAEATRSIDIGASIVAVMNDYSRQGFTTITSLGLLGDTADSLLLYNYLASPEHNLIEQSLNTLGLLPDLEHPLPRHFIYLPLESMAELPEGPENGDEFFSVLGIKLWYDGSPYTGSMYLTEPYLNTPLTRDSLKIPADSRGKALMTQNALHTVVRQMDAQGWQVSIHTQGDQSSLEVIDSFMQPGDPPLTRQHRLEHLLLLPTELLPQIGELQLSLSFHINHLYYYGDALAHDIIGMKRAEKMLPVASALAQRIPVTLHADLPMYPDEPFSLIATAVARQTRQGYPLAASEAISVTDALYALTLNAAKQLGMEDTLGSIEVGKLADFTIVNVDPLAVPETQLRGIRVLQTIIQGRTAFRAAQETDESAAQE
jgi:predicted amidohydrolase YtcJ